MIVVGVLSFIAPVVLSSASHDKERRSTRWKSGRKMAKACPSFLAGGVAIAAGGAMIFAQFITKKR